MSTVEERFEIVLSGAKDVMRLAEDLGALGIYGRDEQAALTILMTTLDKAMRVLDPDGANKFLEKVISDKMKMPESSLENLKAALSGYGPETGQYL